MLKLSVFIELLAAGAMVRNATRRFNLLDADLGGGARMLYVLLFVITGASLSLSALGDIGWAAAAFVAARAFGKWTGVMAAAPTRRCHGGRVRCWASRSCPCPRSRSSCCAT